VTDDLDGFETDDNETVYAQGRVGSRVYASKSFPLVRSHSLDDGTPARFICKVFDPESESMVDWEIDDWVIRETPAGRYQVKLLVARESGNVKELWIQRVPGVGQSGSATVLLHLKQPDISKLLDLIKLIEVFPIEGDTTVRLDDALIHDLLSDPESMARLYQRAPDQVRALISNDAAARDVLALEARRTELDRFRRLLYDPEFFDEQVLLAPGRRAETVWQQLFERNPWMLGVTLAGQLLTSWNDARLEQMVVGSSVSTVGKRTDALMRTSGRIRSMVFTEIKTHRTPLLYEEYRPGCWSASTSLTGAVAQLQGTVHRAVTQIGERLVTTTADGSDMPGDFTYLLRPRSFVIIGDLSQFIGDAGGDHKDKIRSFELFRNQLQEPDILTFDEVLARAEWALDLAEADED
jgi:Domain of unknown function (DUF4263)